MNVLVRRGRAGLASRPCPSPGVVAAVSVLAATALVLLAAPATAAQLPAGPTTVVALGDSAASGEGAGDYEPGTRGEAGNWCHRSAHAYVHRLGVAERSVNLACSGSRAADVAPGGDGRYGEGSQAQRLGALAREARVTAVVLQVGGNDDPALVPTGIACIRAFLDPAVPGCRDTVGPQWPARLAAMAPKVEAAMADVRAAMRRAGYTDTGYTLVLASYALAVHRTHDRRARRPGLPVQPRRRRVGAHGGVPPAVRDPARGGRRSAGCGSWTCRARPRAARRAAGCSPTTSGSAG